MITSEILEKSTHPIRTEIQRMISLMSPFDLDEMEHLKFVQKWIATGAEIFRIAKPATPDPHLVSYFVLIDETANKILLVDHKKAGLWLPPGGHAELNEHPKETVRREIFEELRIQADFISHDPLFVTVTKTVGQTAGHTDVTLWYILRGNSAIAIEYDQEEFNGINWFDIDGIPYENSDPHLERFVQKFIKTRGSYEHFIPS